LSFGLTAGEYRSEGGLLIGPSGTIAPITSLRRTLRHDITNALAASALVLETGLADVAAIERALGTFIGPAHRLERLGSHNGADWFNDSKATTPHAASAAIRSFENIVLIAGGADKGVDLSSMADEAWRCTGVLAIGATASTIANIFASVTRVESVGTLERAVERAAVWASPGDIVLLSPGCASLDQFTNFQVRGEAFRMLFTQLAGQQLQGVSA
jgi:UDP-N-acetylmuramoylalanine--D-glutamate ligase